MPLRRTLLLGLSLLVPPTAGGLSAAVPTAAPQAFQQEVAGRFSPPALPDQPIQLIDFDSAGAPRVFTSGRWYQLGAEGWREIAGSQPGSAQEFTLPDTEGRIVTVRLPWAEVRQVLRSAAGGLWVATEADSFALEQGQLRSLGRPGRGRVNQIALAPDGVLHAASSGGLFRRAQAGWEPLAVPDGEGRVWAAAEVSGVGFDAAGQLWFATRAGVGCRTPGGWRFYTGREGLPWNDFTGIAAGPGGSVWFGTHLGAVFWDGGRWHYRQGPRWLPHDDVRQVACDSAGRVWLGTEKGLGVIERRPMTLAEKAAFYEDEIARFIKRTPYGFVAEAPLRKPADKSTANPQDSDNDGLWTAMYGAGECFAYGATQDPAALARARQAFEALRFLQKVTQGGNPAPPKGYVARTVRPSDWPDPNVGRLEGDREEQKRDALWKAYEPRWPKSADGRWYWKSDTSSDELDGHFFFYPLYFELCANTDAEKNRVREVVRDLADHLVAHGFTLQDHDGKPTRWGVFGPQYLNQDPRWWPERGLNSLSLLTYLTVAAHVTGDAKYAPILRELIDRHGYAQNAMYPKVQHGPGSGNQSDDEMAFMCFYTLLRYSTDEALKHQIRYSFYRYWANEAPELNPFFHFAYAAQNLEASVTNPWGQFPIAPWPDWFEDSLATLRGIPLDRLNWPHRNSHRLDLQPLAAQQSVDLYEPRTGRRAGRVGGKVLPVENRHFNHWNTDPWHLDYGGQGDELAAGTVYLLPYYMGLFHGFVAKP